MLLAQLKEPEERDTYFQDIWQVPYLEPSKLEFLVYYP